MIGIKRLSKKELILHLTIEVLKKKASYLSKVFQSLVTGIKSISDINS